MALLATSCTMRNKPGRLLDKGPEYLRTRTNSQLFEHRRKSAVELLAASRPQYVKSPALLQTQQDLALTPDRLPRSRKNRSQLPPRSKSEFDISLLHQTLSDEAGGSADDDSNDDDPRTTDTTDGEWPSSAVSRSEQSAGATSTGDAATASAGEDISTTASISATTGGAIATTTTSSSITDWTTSPSAVTPAEPESERPEAKIDQAREREDEGESLPPASPPSSTAAFPATGLTSPSASTPPPLPPKPKPKPKPRTRPELKPKPTPKPRLKPKPNPPSEPVIYTARPVFITLASSHESSSYAGGTCCENSDQDPCGSISAISASQASVMSEGSPDRTPTNPTGGDVAQAATQQQQHQQLTPTTPVDESAACDVSMPVGRSKPVDLTDGAGGGVTASGGSSPGVSASGTCSPAPRSSGQAAISSDPSSAVPGCPVPRSFSDISCHHSRAGSDVSSEASRASRASRTSRASRASAGAHLERFFNEMGMEKDILDPLLLRQQRYFSDGLDGADLSYGSVSSLDSDARSMCSAVSRPDRDLSSDAESLSERGQQQQQQTSVVERNARIIKWLCSVRKAKQNPPPPAPAPTPPPPPVATAAAASSSGFHGSTS